MTAALPDFGVVTQPERMTAAAARRRKDDFMQVADDASRAEWSSGKGARAIPGCSGGL
jgi:hypothetical protein